MYNLFVQISFFHRLRGEQPPSRSTQIIFRTSSLVKTRGGVSRIMKESAKTLLFSVLGARLKDFFWTWLGWFVEEFAERKLRNVDAVHGQMNSILQLAVVLRRDRLDGSKRKKLRRESGSILAR